MKEYGHRVRPPMEGETMAGVESRISAPLDKLEPLLPKRIKAIHIDELTSGIIRSEDSTFYIDLEDSLLTITDDAGQVRVLAGLSGGNYGFQLLDEDGVTILDSFTGHLILATVGAGQFVLVRQGITNIAQFGTTQIQLTAATVFLNGNVKLNCTSFEVFGVSGGGVQASALASISAGGISSGDATTDTIISNIRDVVNAMRTNFTYWGFFDT